MKEKGEGEWEWNIDFHGSVASGGQFPLLRRDKLKKLDKWVVGKVGVMTRTVWPGGSRRRRVMDTRYLTHSARCLAQRIRYVRWAKR